MPTDIVIPSLGESVSEGVIASWLKENGEYVERDEPVLELETDKITTEIPAPAAGAVQRSVGEGETVKVGAKVGAIDESAEKPAKEKKQKEKKTEQAEPKQGEQSKLAAKEAEKKEADQPAEANAGAGQRQASSRKQAAARSETPERSQAHEADQSAAATPLARKIAEDYGVDLSRVSGTGAGGRIREQDVLAFIQSHPNGAASGAGVSPAQERPSTGETTPPASTSAPAPFSRETSRERMSPLRQRIASRLVEAQHTAAMLTTFNECDMTQVMALRKRYKEAFQEKHGVGLGFMSFFVKAAVSALQTFPRVNSQIGQSENGDPEIVAHHYCDIAVAVGTSRGLVVPVVRNCESLSFARIESAIRDLAERAQAGKLALEEMQGGTFTISNGGIYGSMMSTPILNPPQSAILGMHNIVRRPVEDPAKPGAGEVAVRPMMYLALSYDHRLIDGAEAVGFLKHIKECIEAPERLTLGV